ncbi:hypothetical protein COCNU_scaffold004704G000010 [Cocos nucifera]|nr:hypothetical protein [Cocos nucifera]
MASRSNPRSPRKPPGRTSSMISSPSWIPCPSPRSFNNLVYKSDPKVEVPALLVMGKKDYCLKFPGVEDYIRSGTVKSVVPDLEIIDMPGGSHFVQEQFPDQVNQHIIKFLKNHI